ncbi:MAG: hypothetical protein WAU11_02910 [Ignavibacteriaceae bacterium]
MSNKKITLKQEELYDRVWHTPMIKLAAEYGVSENGLKKICGKLKIPVPPVGYWQKLTYGYNVQKPIRLKIIFIKNFCKLDFLKEIRKI